jgi:cysteine desulfurase/selenocysteine lyase
MICFSEIPMRRSDFPALADPALAFLDIAASAQKPGCVLDAMQEMAVHHYANVHRGVYRLAQEATDRFETARRIVAQFLGASRPEEVVFTRNATEAVNLVAQSWGRHHLGPDDEILLTEMEHHSNLIPWQMLAQATGAKLRFLPVNPVDGSLCYETLDALIGPRTKLVAATQASNVLGTLVDLPMLARAARAVGARFLVDGCQGIVHQQPDVASLDCDFFVFSGHKLYGPTGIGVLWARHDLLEDMPPLFGGGDMLTDAEYDHFTAAPPPARFEAGTPAIVEAHGLATAIRYVQGIGYDAIVAHETALQQELAAKLSEIDGVRLIGTAQNKAGIQSFVCSWAHPMDIAPILDHAGVCVRFGHHCAQPLLKKLGLTSTLRASLGLYNQSSDIDALTAALRRAHRLLA